MRYQWLPVIACFTSLPLSTAHSAESAGRVAHEAHAATHSPLAQAGQSAFAALAEIVAILETDPATDWTHVNVTRLRDHLIDMDEVLMRSQATMQEVEGAILLSFTGTDRTLEALRRMIPAHARMMNGYRGWHSAAVPNEDIVIWTLAASSSAERTRIKALGPFGLLTLGSHHGPHHLAMARGEFVPH